MDLNPRTKSNPKTVLGLRLQPQNVLVLGGLQHAPGLVYIIVIAFYQDGVGKHEVKDDEYKRDRKLSLLHLSPHYLISAENNNIDKAAVIAGGRMGCQPRGAI